MSLPPGPAAPARVQTLEWVFRPARFMERCERRYGDPFTARFGAPLLARACAALAALGMLTVIVAPTPAVAFGGLGLGSSVTKFVAETRSLDPRKLEKLVSTVLVVGLVATHAALPSDSLVVRAMQWLLVVQVLAVGAFVAAQAGGALGGGTRWLQKLGWLSGSPGQTLVQVNDELAHFYRREPARLTLSIFFHFCAWLIGALEPWLILRWIGLPVSLAQATAIEAFSTGIRFAAFLVPGYVGALEAGHVVIFSALGLGAPAGLSFTLIRRVRELAWTGLGFLALAPLKAQAPPTAGRS